ncbi:MAG TPA: hypothetical protein VJW76_10570 [Verrucomicrobiae bacterium]|nr:hypothetical protein [Verrucomicrobiae bacterium]
MNNWSLETRSRVAAVALSTIGLIALIWFTLVLALETKLKDRDDKIVALQKAADVTRSGIRLAESYRDEVERGGLVLDSYENHMAQGEDPYRWLMGFLRGLEKHFNVSIIEPPRPQIVELKFPPRLPYEATSCWIAGTARYHDFGIFLAELENSSPFIRLRNLSVDANISGVATENEADRLTFRMEFVTLVKPRAGQR